MIVATQLPRVFIFESGTQSIPLDDPNPNWEPKQVRIFYANTYPELAVSPIIGPTITEDKLIYNFKSVFGTKG